MALSVDVNCNDHKLCVEEAQHRPIVLHTAMFNLQ